MSFVQVFLQAEQKHAKLTDATTEVIDQHSYDLTECCLALLARAVRSRSLRSQADQLADLLAFQRTLLHRVIYYLNALILIKWQG